MQLQVSPRIQSFSKAVLACFLGTHLAIFSDVGKNESANFEMVWEMKKIVGTALIAVMLSACGGGGGNSGTCIGSDAVCFPKQNVAAYNAPILAASSVANQCAVPRPSGTIDPFTQQPYGDVQGSLTTEKSWIRAFVNETYLWYADVSAVDPSPFTIGATVPYVNVADNTQTSITLTSNYDVVDTYFNSQRSLQMTSTGKPKDQFHFTYPTNEWVALTTAGSSVGYGAQIALLASRPPRNVLVVYADLGSVAAQNNVSRGAQFLSVNGVDVVNGSDVDTINEGLFSPIAGKRYTFQILDQGSATPRTVTMTAASVTSTPVQNVRTLPAPYSSVGYIQFNDHIATAESQLIDAINQLKAANSGAGINDLVLDIRYNGGGLLGIASELAYMIAGTAATTGKTFEKQSFSDKNPFSMTDADTITPFHSVTQGYSTTFGQALPQLGLPRVFVITGSGTCSASEAVMNGLRGAGIEVIQIGGTTCGKPYGFYPQDNCGVTYFTIQFKGVNNAGFGDYADGFIPAGTGRTANNLRGCAVADDFTKSLGDITEGRLAAALQYRANGSCNVAASAAASATTSAIPVVEPVLARSLMRENRFFRPKAGRLK